MTKYASYGNKATQPVPVAAWYDSDVANHIDFTQAGFVQVSEAQWAARNDKIWVVEGNAVAEYVAPVARIEVVQSTRCSLLSRACAQQIISGFSSSSLGAAHNYASTTVDQQNIVQSAQCAKGGLLSCADSTGVWARVAHTQAQAQQVLEDFVTARDAARAKLNGLEAQINAATTSEAVQAVVWEAASGG